jgi:hypothetical protein
MQRTEVTIRDTALKAKIRNTRGAEVRPDGGCQETMYRSRSAIHCSLKAETYNLEGGLRYVPAVAGSAHSQAPPIP